MILVYLQYVVYLYVNDTALQGNLGTGLSISYCAKYPI
jgi:hypothetical protein